VPTDIALMHPPRFAHRAAAVALMLMTLLLIDTAQAQLPARRSGFDFMGASTQAIQRDDLLNPGMLWVQDGAALWDSPGGSSGKSCASCHARAQSSMRGVAAHYPAIDEATLLPIALNQRINLCRQKHQQAPAWALESRELLGLEAFIGHQSRGMPLAPSADARLQPFMARGEAMFNRRLGALNLSCANCHDQHAGQRLGGSPIPQAHATGYPLYRLEWQTLGSLQRRLRGCLAGVRAEPYPFGAREWVELELYLAERARGMRIETPAVRP